MPVSVAAYTSYRLQRLRMATFPMWRDLFHRFGKHSGPQGRLRLFLVPWAGLEPASLSAPPSEDGVFSGFTTGALC